MAEHNVEVYQKPEMMQALHVFGKDSLQIQQVILFQVVLNIINGIYGTNLVENATVTIMDWKEQIDIATFR